MNQNPVLFYFWAHSEIEELRTEKLVELVGRAEVLFKEHNSPDLETSAEIERDFNEYSRKGVISNKFRVFLQSAIKDPNDGDLFLLDLTKGTRKRYAFEMSLEADFDINEHEAIAASAFFKCPLEEALQIYSEFLQREQAYQTNRESSVAQQILGIPETVLVMFGAGHYPSLLDIVAEQRPAEVQFPYEGYPIDYGTCTIQDFRRTGELNQELYLSSMMDGIVRRALKEKYGRGLTSREVDLVSHHYAGIIGEEQVIEYKDYLLSCSRLLIGINRGDVFESFLKREGLPLIPEVLSQYSDRTVGPSFSPKIIVAAGSLIY